MSGRPARRQRRDEADTQRTFGELVNADHIIAPSAESMGLTGERDASVIVDRYSDYKDCFPEQPKSAEDTLGALLEFLGKTRPKYIHTDAAPELTNAVKSLQAAHGRSRPYRHQSNSYCERTVRKIVEGARTLLEHAGLPSCFWRVALRYWCCADNTAVRE